MSQSVIQKKTNIPVHLSDLSAFDDAFCTMKEKFANEMRKVEEQMTKFSSDLMHVYGQTSSVQIGTAAFLQDSSPTSWETLTNSPLVQGDDNNKALELKFDVSQFDPSEISVRILNDVLYVSAHHEEKSDSSAVLREYNREFLLPKGTDLEAIVSSLSRDGVLTVHAPLPNILEEPYSPT